MLPSLCWLLLNTELAVNPVLLSRLSLWWGGISPFCLQWWQKRKIKISSIFIYLKTKILLGLFWYSLLTCPPPPCRIWDICRSLPRPYSSTSWCYIIIFCFIDEIRYLLEKLTAGDVLLSLFSRHVKYLFLMTLYRRWNESHACLCCVISNICSANDCV